MIDSLGRNIDYMRISITDRCNLRCKYCSPDGFSMLTHDDILRYEEILRVCRAAAKTGIKSIKVTGGEPLVRKGCINFLRNLKSLPGIEYVTITTNGVLLERFIDDMADMKLDGVNISLDSLNPDTYKQITNRNFFYAVWRSLNKAIDAGLRVKVNCVPMRGLNDADIIPIARLAERLPIDVRFIEFMPTSAGESFNRITGSEIYRRLLKVYPDLINTKRRGFGPARYFKSSKMSGSVGIIDAIGKCFCTSCNRVRLTSDGFLKQCLFHEDGLDIRGMLRNGSDDTEIEAAFKRTVYHKPERHMFESRTSTNMGIKNMAQIGG